MSGRDLKLTEKEKKYYLILNIILLLFFSGTMFFTVINFINTGEILKIIRPQRIIIQGMIIDINEIAFMDGIRHYVTDKKNGEGVPYLNVLLKSGVEREFFFDTEGEARYFYDQLFHIFLDIREPTKEQKGENKLDN